MSSALVHGKREYDYLFLFLPSTRMQPQIERSTGSTTTPLRRLFSRVVCILLRGGRELADAIGT